MQNRWLFLLLGFLCTSPVSAQEFSCASDVIEQSMITTYPDYAQERARLETFMQQRMHNTNARMLNFGCQSTAVIYYIPIVFQVMHLGEAVGTGSNVSNAALQNCLDTLNKYFLSQGI